MTERVRETHPAVAAIVLYFRYGREVFETLTALTLQTLPVTSIVLVDNASEDGVAREIQARFEKVTVAFTPENRGYGGGMNYGLARVPQADAVLLLTHDCVLAPNALERMVDELEITPDVGVVGPLVGLRTRRDLVFSAGGYVDPRGMEGAHHGYGEPLDRWQSQGATDVEWVDGACQLIRRRTLQDVGGFDEDYFWYWEEVAYHARVRAKGWRVRCVSTAVAWQDPGDYLVYYQVRNQLRFLWRHRSRSTFLAGLARAAYKGLVLGGERRVRLGAIWDFARGYGGPAPPSRVRP